MKTIIFILILGTQMPPSFGQGKSGKMMQTKVPADTIYIPADLNECIAQLDKMFDDSSKIKINAMTEDEFSARVHLNFGMWMRNNWGLWKGSKLSRFFHDKGIYHPDDMSGIIVDSYYRYLTGREIKFEEQIKFYHDYWENARKKELQIIQEEFSNYHKGDTVLFNYTYGFVSKLQEDKYDNDICMSKGIITATNEEEYFIKVKLLDGCDRRGIISYDNEGALVYTKSTGKMEKPKKHVIIRMKAGEERWFNYKDWKTKD